MDNFRVILNSSHASIFSTPGPHVSFSLIGVWIALPAAIYGMTEAHLYFVSSEAVHFVSALVSSSSSSVDLPVP
jgi:hypothetical protein